MLTLLISTLIFKVVFIFEVKFLFEAFIFKVVFITFADFRLLTLQQHIGPLYVNLGGNKLGQRQSQTPI